MASIALNTALVASLVLIPPLFGDFIAYQVGLFLIYGIAAQGIGFLWGKTGILPFGQAMFFGIAAYGCAQILTHVQGVIVQIALLTLIIGCLSIIAFLMAFIVFKGRANSGPFFSLITLALVMICEQLAGTVTEFTGGFNGISGFATLANIDQFGALYYVIVTVAVLTTFLLTVLDRLPAGLIVRAIADNEHRLQLFGFPTHLVKGLVFALSAALAAIAGILFANHQGIVTPTSIGFLLSANLVIWTAVGGRYHVLGPLIGAVGIGYLSAELRDELVYWEVILALLFIIVVLRAPGGIAEFLADLIKKFTPQKVSFARSFLKPPKSKIDNSPTKMLFAEVHVKVGAVRILNGVNLALPETGIVCVIGPNGAGKTSLLNIITGGLMLSKGSVTLQAEQRSARIDSRATHKAFKCGIAQKLQVPSIFFSMTVFENLVIAMMAGRAGLLEYFKPSVLLWRTKELEELLETPALPLREQMDVPVSGLAQGHRQFLEFAMATAVEPRILLLDEPCAGLSPEETQLMTQLINEFHTQNNGIVLLIEHDMSIVRSLSDQVVVLHQGAVMFQGSYQEVSADPNVQKIYAGGTK